MIFGQYVQLYFDRKQKQMCAFTPSAVLRDVRGKRSAGMVLPQAKTRACPASVVAVPYGMGLSEKQYIVIYDYTLPIEQRFFACGSE